MKAPVVNALLFAPAAIGGWLTLRLHQFFYRSRLSVGAGTQVRGSISIRIYSGRIAIGQGVFFNRGCSLTVMEQVVIGDRCLFGEGVKIYDHNHGIQAGLPYKEQPFTTGPIHIGDNCWLGTNVVVLKGVRIGNNAVIGAGVVVYKDVAPGEIIVANSFHPLARPSPHPGIFPPSSSSPQP